jgi:uncharacterized surface anchored protein
MQNLIFKTCLTLTLAAICCNAQKINGQNVGVLTGSVKLRDKALPRVMVILRSADGAQKSSVSNSKGEYEIRNLRSGTYLLTVANTPYVLSDGIAGTFMQLEINGSGVTTTDIALIKGGVATGCVEYASKQPAIERQVIYENSDLMLNGFSLMSFREAVTTNDRGCFRLYGLPSGKYRVGVGKPVNGLSTDLSAPFSPNYYPGVQRQGDAELIEITAGQERNLGTLVLKNQTRTGGVKGTFIDSATGDPVPNLSFQLVRYVEGVISSISTLNSDEAGEFQVENQALGRYRIQPALRAGSNTFFTFQSIPFELSETDTSELVIQCTSLTASIRGEVTINNNDSASNKDCSIALKAGDALAAGDSDIYRITLNRGKFELSGLPRGVYSLVILPLRISLQYEQAQVGTQFLRGSAAPFGMLKIDLTAGEQVVKIFLKEAADKTP